MVVIGPALETFLTVVGVILLVLLGVGLVTKPFWKRIARYFRRWIERDRLLEQQKRDEAECRRQAQQEVGEFCHDDILQGNTPAVPATDGATEVGTATQGSGQPPVTVAEATATRAEAAAASQTTPTQPLQAGHNGDSNSSSKGEPIADLERRQ